MGFLYRLAESFKVTGVDEHVQAGECRCQLIAGELSGKDGIRHLLLQLLQLRAITDNDHLDIIAAVQRRQPLYGLLRREPSDITNNRLALRAPLLPELFTTLCRGKANRINTAAPAVDITNLVILQVLNSRRRRRQRSGAGVVNHARPQPRCRGEPRQLVVLGKTRNVRLIDGHSRDAQCLGSQRARTTEHKWRSQVDNIRLKLRQRRRYPTVRHTNR